MEIQFCGHEYEVKTKITETKKVVGSHEVEPVIYFCRGSFLHQRTRHSNMSQTQYGLEKPFTPIVLYSLETFYDKYCTNNTRLWCINSLIFLHLT